MRGRSKYGAKKTVVDGITFDSKKESRRWQELCMLQKGGVISDLQRQVRIGMIGRDAPIRTPTGRQAKYVADFVYMENGIQVIEDAKGFETKEFKLKKAILAAMGIEIKVT